MQIKALNVMCPDTQWEQTSLKLWTLKRSLFHQGGTSILIIMTLMKSFTQLGPHLRVNLMHLILSRTRNKKPDTRSIGTMNTSGPRRKAAAEVGPIKTISKLCSVVCTNPIALASDTCSRP